MAGLPSSSAISWSGRARAVRLPPARLVVPPGELLPGVQVEHVLDESLLQDTIRAGGLTDAVRERFQALAREALATKPEAVMMTWSSVGPATEGLDVLRIDQAMAERAVALG